MTRFEKTTGNTVMVMSGKM